MREFFRGWRRKVGCVALALALVLTSVWVRSLTMQDRSIVICLSKLSRQQVATDRDGFWCVHEVSTGPMNFGYVSALAWGPRINQRDRGWPYRAASEHYQLDWRMRAIGFDVGRFHWCDQCDAEDETAKWAVVFRIPFWSIVLPLTAVSAWLLIITPRRKQVKEVRET